MIVKVKEGRNWIFIGEVAKVEIDNSTDERDIEKVKAIYGNQPESNGETGTMLILTFKNDTETAILCFDRAYLVSEEGKTIEKLN